MKIRSLLSSQGLRGQLLRGGIGSFGVKSANMFFMLATSVVFARAAGAKGFGIYAFVFAIIQILSIPAQFGFQVLIIREVAAYKASKQWAYLKGILRRGVIVIVLASALILLAGTVVIGMMAENIAHIQLKTFAWGFALLPMIAFGNYFGAALRGLGKVTLGQLPQLVLRPGGFLVCLVCFWIIFSGNALTADLGMALHALAGLFAVIIGGKLLYSNCPSQIRFSGLGYDDRRWAKSAAFLSLIAGMQIVNRYTDLVILGALVDPETVGVYRIAAQGSLLIAFGLQAVNMVIAPQFSRMYVQRDSVRLQRLATASARVALLVAVPLVVAFIFLGDWILLFVFGEEFQAGYTALVILSVGQLINAMMGSVVILLNMTGHEANVAKGLILSAGLNIILNLVLIPILGMEGAAVSTASTLIFWNVLLAWNVYIKTGIKSWAFVFLK